MSIDKEKLLALIDETELEEAHATGNERLGWVYFIVTIGAPRCKIGFTKTTSGITNRLKSLQTGSADELVIMAAHPGTIETERHLHERFSDSRIRGEWFEITDEIRAYLVQTIWAMTELSLREGWQPSQWMIEGTSVILETLGTISEGLAAAFEVEE